MKFNIILHSILLLSLLFFSYLFVDPNLSYLKFLFTGFSIHNRMLVASIFFSFILIFYFSYLILLKRSTNRKLEKKQLILLVLITIVILLISYPAMLSYDIFNYITTAKVAYFYHENPYVIMPIEFVGEPYLLFTRAANKLALYGVGWIALTAAPFIMGFGNFLLIVFNFKLLVTTFYIATLWLLYKQSFSSNKLSNNLEPVIFFGFNPLVVIETLVSGHNDIIMVFFALAAFYLLKKNNFAAALFSLFISISIKYATLFLLPIFIYIAYRKLRKKIIDWDRAYLIAGFSMFVIFLLSPLREEIYPWYAIWIIVFISLIENKLLKAFSIVFSFSLLLRYIPFMATGTYFGYTPLFKITLTAGPIILFFISLLFRPKWLEKFFHFL